MRNRKAILAAGALILSGGLIGGSFAGSFDSRTVAIAEEIETFPETADIVPQEYVNGLPDVSDIVEACQSSVVSITNTIEVTQTQSNNGMDFFFGGWNNYYNNNPGDNTTTTEQKAYGSGVIIGQNDDELLVLTNNHVAVYDQSGSSIFYQYTASTKSLSISFPDGAEYEAKLKGANAEADLAVVAVPLEELSEETRAVIRVATIGNSDEAKVGQGVIAIGNALGLGQSATIGYISALNREVKVEDGVTRNLMQVDAAINSGNSGGGLFNGKGELIGINSAKYSKVGVEGIGYAIPISNVTEIVEGLKNHITRDALAETERGYLGIVGQDVNSSYVANYGYPAGAQIVSIVENSPAQASGLQINDIITAVDGDTINDYTGLRNLLSYYAPGDTVVLTVQRINGSAFEEQTISVTLTERDSIQ